MKATMDIKQLNDQIGLKNHELQITKDYKQKKEINKQLKILRYKKEIEQIKLKIKQIC